MEKWEYKTINTETKGAGEGIPDINNFNMVLNQLGNVGWELVSCFPTTQEQGNTRAVIAVLKRKINSSFSDRGNQSANIQGRAHGYPEKGARTYQEESRAYGKSPGYAENRGDYPRKSSGYSNKGNGYKGKSPGFQGKNSGYKGKGFPQK